ncbi:winged helix-turn-helix domain-containing tetratricopeptide repeat protein [Sphingopyxis sp. YR583]|uniref:winged helix-turn-helix domain-containing tetratricopeptide repeat protein n=1 Tax=Sphingopyxis sp. YR583 TaxID=1881047 RepID=UPI0015A5A50C|nr:winged helix-turn-helix domain-containing protein [Sphingopyxis sp. YR583]
MENLWRNAALSFGASLIYRFEGFELDPGKFELRELGEAKHLEPQVLSLLILLASNADRLVSKDEIIEKIWGGRIVSEAAVASRVKAARQALGDDGKEQRFIRTVHGKGFRFGAQVTFDQMHEPARVFATVSAEATPQITAAEERPSIAVLPFHLVGGPGPLSIVADALADELIGDLSRLRWLLVIARTSTFRFRGQDIGCEQVGAALNVRYCLTGTLEEARGKVMLAVTLARTCDGAVVWADRFTAGGDELHELRCEVLDAVVANLETRIIQNEVERARRMPAGGLDAWSSYHLGLDHMFRFNRSDNARAASLFAQALARDPNFSRALSGLSFTRFQDCFLQYSPDSDAMAEQARAFAERAVQVDPLDPFAHLNLGRSLWFADAVPESMERLSAAITLSPNYAQAIYSKAWAEMTQCDVGHSDENARLALRLSPLDPLRYAMLGVRSVSALMRGDHQSALEWGERAAQSPGAHKHIAVIAAIAAEAAGHHERAAQWIARARQLDPQVSQATFLRSFPFAATTGREVIERTLQATGL